MSPDSRSPLSLVGATGPDNIVVIAVDNKKGGVTKTTTTFNLGTLLAAYFGLRVLLADLDSDRCLTDAIYGGSFNAHSASKLTILDALARPANGLAGATFSYDLMRFADALNRISATVLSSVAPKRGGRMDLITGSEDLADAPLLFERTSPQPVGNFDQALYWLFRQPEITRAYDVVIIDIGPGWDQVTRSGLFAADRAIIPVEPASLSIEALKRHQVRIARANSERARAGVAGQTDLAGVLISRVYAQSPLSGQFASALREALRRDGTPCFASEIPVSDAVLMSMTDHVPAWGAYPDDPGAQAYMRLAAELAA